MSQLTLSDLSSVLTECAGADDGAALTEAERDLAFTELGYDSLALLETAALVKERYGVTLTDEEVTTIATPAEFLDHVNRALTPTG
ncbi:acyl carrier protein [Streptomyces sp. NPDC003717]|uniref:acyl carrier protein n=1 Tax=Streptomyces sp. NPDC003717 TaxID=3154276 RepID=UPI00339E0119